MVLFDKDLAMYFPFSEGSGLTVFDRSKYQNNGVVDGAIFVRPYNDMSISSDDEGDSPLVIYDDDETFWTGVGEGAGAISAPVLAEELVTVRKGISSLEHAVGAGANQYATSFHNYGAGQDWSQYDYITAWYYGINSGGTIYIYLANEVNGAFANYYRWDVTDNFSGWRRFFFPLARPNASGGAFDITSVLCIQVQTITTGTWYFDRITADKGNWRFGECLQFDATNDEVQIPFDTSLNPLDEMTCAAWVNIDAVRDCGIISKTASVVHLLGFDGATVRFRVTATSGADQASWTYPATWVGEWHYIVGTFKDGIIYLYIDGLLVDTIALAGVILTNIEDLRIGSDRGGRFFGGLISEPRIYRYALSQTEIRTLYKEKEVD